MSSEKNYQFEHYERYMGDAEEVICTMEDCPDCGVKLVITHYADGQNLLMKETAKCLECEFGQRKTVYVLN